MTPALQTATEYLRRSSPTDEAETSLSKASSLISRLNNDPAKIDNPDLLIAEILFREAKKLMPADAEVPKTNGEAEPKGGETEKASETP